MSVESQKNNGTDVERSVESNVLNVVEIEKQLREGRTFGEKLSEEIALFAGSMTFVYLHILAFAGWIVLNAAILSKPFDPFPFTFLTLIVALEAIFISTFILISQNHEAKLTENRNQLELQINMLAEQENTKTLELVQAIAKKVGVDFDERELNELLDPIDPERLTKMIAKAGTEKKATHLRS